MSRYINRTIALVWCAFASACLLTGCGDGAPDNSAEAAEEINAPQSGLVRIVKRGEEELIAKYLTPEYLAAAELESRGYDEEELDSLKRLYSGTMSFHIAVKLPERKSTDPATMQADSRERESGVVDVEASRRMFRMECGDSVWYAVHALPESRVGEAGQTWFVVFQIDPRRALKSQQSITVVYAPQDGGEITRFTYNVEDLLRPEFIASTN